MINYLILLTSKNSKSFCYYNTPDNRNSKKDIIDFNLFKESILFAIKNKCGLNLLYGDEPLPAKYENELKQIEHIKIMPLKLKKYYKKGVYIIEDSDLELAKNIKKNNDLNLILRLKKENLGNLSEIFNLLLWRFKRFNLIFTDLYSFTDNDFKIYRKQLKIIRGIVYKLYRNGDHIELNFLTDRLFLKNMNNCDAGLKHLTIAPNGKFYLCPGFYLDSKENSIGDLISGYLIKNENLLHLKNALICSNCDAWHCKRCYYLNKKLTLEINTPSVEQCIVSHIERNETRLISEQLKRKSKSYKNLIQIPEIDYLDPFQILNVETKLSPEEKCIIFSELLSKPLEKLSTRELLMHLYNLDKEIFIELKNRLSKTTD
jgi:CXXX repeat peptide maturase